VSETVKIKVGVSSCLLGVKVRWNGDHKQDRYITDILGRFFEWVPVCPEFETGMGVPRETVRLVKDGAETLMLGTKSRKDWTVPMRKFARQKTAELAPEALCGFIFKKGSPSCGMERVALYNPAGMPAGTSTRGLFAAAFMDKFPLVPVEEEGRLNDDKIRENFIVRVFSFYRLRQLFAVFSRGALVSFHTAHKYLLMAHSVKHYTGLGRLVAKSNMYSPAELKERYSEGFMEALANEASARKNVNVLQHMMGYLKKQLDAEEKKNMLEAIEDYHKELVPLIVPLTLVSHFVKKFRIEYLLNQVYLNPHPKELMLRNHV